MLVDYDYKSHAFHVLTKKTYEIIEIKYPLQDKDNKGNQFKENVDEYDYKIFYKKDFKENEIYQIIENNIGKRIGWIFPISSIISTSHDFADNSHYCRYAFLAYMLLLQNEISDQDICDKEFNEIINTQYFFSDAIILIYKKELIKDILDFKLENYYASLYEYGYYIKPNYANPHIKIPKSGERITLQSVSECIVSDKYIEHFWEMLCIEKHPIVKFHILYQIIELLIEDVLIFSLEDTINQFKNKKIYTRSLRERIKKVEAEKDRISILIEKCSTEYDRYKELHEECISFLTKRGREEVGFPDSIYSVRNFIVHDYRFIADDNALKEIEDINYLFETFVLNLIIHYKH